MPGIIKNVAETYRELLGQKKFLVWLTVFLILKAMDFSFTVWGVRNYGVEAELNPLAAWFFGQFGPGPGMALWGLLMVGIVTPPFIYFCYRYFPVGLFGGRVWWFFWVVNGLFFLVAASWIHLFLTT